MRIMNSTLVILVFCVSGCMWPTHVDPVEKLPVIAQDSRPKMDFESIANTPVVELSSVERKLLGYLYEMSIYARKRDARIAVYNQYAEERNRLFAKQGKKLRSQ